MIALLGVLRFFNLKLSRMQYYELPWWKRVCFQVRVVYQEFKLEDHLIQYHLGVTSLRKLGALRTLRISLRVIKSNREESSFMVTVVVHNQGTTATGGVVCAIDLIEFLRVTVRILVLVTLVGHMHLEFMEDLVEIVTLVDSMAIKQPIIPNVFELFLCLVLGF